MMWMGKVSAWAAVGVGLALLVFAAFQIAQLSAGALDLRILLPIGAGVLLLVGALRTLRKMSGGLRLLAGAWGLSLGMMLQPWIFPGLNYACTVGAAELDALAYLIAPIPLLSLAGFALTVLHKES